MRRTIKLFSMAAMAALALSAFVASAASAGHTWEVDGVLLKAGESRECKTTADPENPTMTLHGVTAGGVTIHLTATTVTSTNCKITQNGSGATAEAVDSVDKLVFGNITVDAPLGCKTSETISTNAVTSHLVTIVHGGVNTAFMTFNPTASTSGTFANVTLTGCAAAETYPVKGQVCAEIDQAGKLTKEQTLKFSATADEACATDKLSIGSGAAKLRGGIIVELLSGFAWGWTAT